MKTRFCSTLAVFTCILLLNVTAQARVIYVSPDGNDGNNGLSWASAKRTIQAGISTAVSGDEVWVRYGVYVERITLRSGVNVYGGFRGTETSLSQRPAFPRSLPDPYESVIDGNQEDSVVRTPSSASRAYRLDGFTIRNGSAQNGGGLYCVGQAADLLTVANCVITRNKATERGGGVDSLASSPTLVACVVEDNRARYGGGIGCYMSFATFTACVISGNEATERGGGVYCDYYSSPIMKTCTISYNRSSSPTGGYTDGGGVACLESSTPVLTHCVVKGNSAYSGGGLCCRNSHPTLTDCDISDNRAGDGGGVFCYKSSPVLTNCRITRNGARWGGGVFCWEYSSPTLLQCIIASNGAELHGGGVHCRWNSSPALTNCTITGNSGSYGAGVSCMSDSFPLLTACTVSNNMAHWEGGGVHSSNGSSPTLSYCTISDNSANDGGGVYCSYLSSPQLTNCIITGNTARSIGGGVYCYWSSPLLINCTITHCIASEGGAVWSNSSESIANTTIAYNLRGIYHASGTAPASFRNNCVWGNTGYNFRGMDDPTGTDGNISADPRLVAGHLLPGSPCIDAGDDSVVTVSQDIDGESRVGGARVDIGADEFHAPIVQGRLVFSDYAGDLPLFVEFGIHGTTEIRRVLLSPEGFFVVNAVPTGQFSLSVKPLSYLRRVVDVDTGQGSVLDVYIELVNGDIDGDNEVTLFDFGRLVAAFGSAPWDANWDERADLDGDGEVTLFDFGILVRNFGAIGDE